MKRVGLALTLVSVAAAYTACSGTDVQPPNNSTGGAVGTTGGVVGTTGGVVGTTGGVVGTTGGVVGTTGGVVGTTGGVVGTTGGTNGGMATGGAVGTTGGTNGGTTTGGATTGGTNGGTAAGGKATGGTTTGGTATGGTATGGTTADDSAMVAPLLHGHTILMPCQGNPQGRVCTPVSDTTRPCTNPTGGPAASYAGAHSHNEQITLGGTPGVRYMVKVRIQGEVEGKTYTGGADANNSGTLPANGLYTAGVADNSANQYNIYFIRTDSPARHYYLNSIGTSSDNRVRHSTFPMDYEFEIEVEGGSKVCMVSADPNTSAIKNCAEPDDGSNCTGAKTVTVANLNPLTLTDIGTQPYNGQFVGITVVSTMRKP